MIRDYVYLIVDPRGIAREPAHIEQSEASAACAELNKRLNDSGYIKGDYWRVRRCALSWPCAGQE